MQHNNFLCDLGGSAVNMNNNTIAPADGTGVSKLVSFKISPRPESNDKHSFAHSMKINEHIFSHILGTLFHLFVKNFST